MAWLANSRWSFRAPLRAATLVRFTVVRVLALLLNLAIMRATLWTGLPYTAGIAISLAVLPPCNLLMHRLWTFRTTEPRDR